MKKRITALIMALVLMMSMAVGAVAASVEQFKDVAPTDWYYTYVKDVVSKNYMNGTSKSTFSPNDNLTRAMASTVLARVENVKVDNTADSGFVDVPVNQWYTGSVKWMFEKKLVKGYGNNKFGPNDFITRQDAAVMMANYLKMKNYKETGKGTVAFVDMAKVSAYAKDSVNLCAEAGIIVGVPNGNFEPLRNITRAEFASMIRKLDKVVYGTIGSGGSSGGDGGDGSTPTSDNYAVEVKFSIPNDRSLTLIADYTVTTAAGHTSGNKTVNDLAMELVSTRTQNANKLKNAIQIMLTNAMNGHTTVTVGGETVTVDVVNGVISATTTVPVASIANNSRTRAAATPDQIRDLVEKLQNSGSVTLTATDVDALNTLQTKLNSMTPAQILNYVQNNGNAAMQQAAAGLTVEAIAEARTDYLNQLQTIKNTVSPSGGEVNIVSPVTMTVAVNLQSYLNRANTLHQNNEVRATETLAAKLGVSDRLSDPAVSAAVSAIYTLSRPGDFVATNGSTDLKLKSVDDYYGKLVSYVNAMCDLRTAVGETSTFYATQLGRAQNRANGYPSLLSGTVLTSSVLANLMGTTGNITNTDTGIILNVNAHVNNASYSDMSTLLQSNLTSLGYSSIAAQIPVSVPSNLTRFFGDYNLTVKINES